MAWFSNNLQTSLDSLKNKVTTSLKEAFDTEEVDNEYLNDDNEDPLERLELAKSKLVHMQSIIQSHEKKIQVLTEHKSSCEDQIQVSSVSSLFKKEKIRFFFKCFFFLREIAINTAASRLREIHVVDGVSNV